MEAQIHTASGGPPPVSYGAGAGSRAAGARAQGRGGQRVAPAGATRSLTAAARRAAATPGRGRRRRQALLQEIEQAARRSRGGSRLSNRQIQRLRAALNALRGR